jgi:hypothetical protein
LSQLTYPQFKATATATTLTFVAERMLTPLQGRRVGAETLVVTMLGAPSQEGLAAVQEAGAGLRQLGARVLVVSPPSASIAFEQEVLAIASSPADVFVLETFESLYGTVSFQSLFLEPFFCLAAPLSSSSTFHASSSLVLPSNPSPVPSLSSMFTHTPSPSIAFSSPIAGASSSVPLSQAFSSSQPGTSALPTSSVQPTTQPVSTTTTPLAFPTPQYCSSFKQMDIVFVISASGKTGAPLFQRFQALTIELLKRIPFGPSSDRFVE